MSDFYMGSERGKSLQFSRKQSGELLGNIDEAEDQIRRYYDKADENFQIIEGIISPVPFYGQIKEFRHKTKEIPSIHSSRPSTSQLYAYGVDEQGFLYGGHGYGVTSSLFWSWIRSLDRAGVVTYFTVNWLDTARMLVAIYKNEQRPEDSHETLQRYTKPRIHLKEHDEFIKDLLYLSDTHKIGIGLKKAQALKAIGFDSIYGLCMAAPDEVACAIGIGLPLAKKILTALGRRLEE